MTLDKQKAAKIAAFSLIAFVAVTIFFAVLRWEGKGPILSPVDGGLEPIPYGPDDTDRGPPQAAPRVVFDAPDASTPRDASDQ